MDKKQALSMIDDYLAEPSHIAPEWVECLLYCRSCILEVDSLKEECKALYKLLDAIAEDK